MLNMSWPPEMPICKRFFFFFLSFYLCRLFFPMQRFHSEILIQADVQLQFLAVVQVNFLENQN